MNNPSHHVDPITDPDWAKVVARLVRTAMARGGIKYPELSRRLQERFGTVQLENNLRSKVSRGTLGAQLLLQILAVCPDYKIDNDEIMALVKSVKEHQK